VMLLINKNEKSRTLRKLFILIIDELNIKCNEQIKKVPLAEQVQFLFKNVKVCINFVEQFEFYIKQQSSFKMIDYFKY